MALTLGIFLYINMAIILFDGPYKWQTHVSLNHDVFLKISFNWYSFGPESKSYTTLKIIHNFDLINSSNMSNKQH